MAAEEAEADDPGALLTEASADGEYSREMELEAYREAYRLLVPDAEPAQEARVEPSWKRAENTLGIDTDSGSYAIPR